MSGRGYKIAAAIAGAFMLSSCGVTKNLPQDSYMLIKNEIKTDKDAPRKERISGKDLSRYVRQDQSKRLLGTNFPAWIYNQADPEKENGWNNLLRKLGSEPVILDTTQTLLSVNNLKLYMNSRGFYESSSWHDIKYKEKNRKAKVTYSVTQGQPYRINSIDHDYQDNFLEQVISPDSLSTLLKVGDIFDIGVLSEERERISDYLLDRGYYNFSIDNISYRADTTAGDHLVDLTMVIRQHLAEYDDQGQPVMENNSVYRIKEIYVYPDFDPTARANGAYRGLEADTLDYRGLRIVSYGQPSVKPHVLRRAINLYPDYIYSDEEVKRAYSNIMRLGYFKSASILFSEAPRNDENTITYVGGSDLETAHTSEKSLICNIRCSPALLQGYTIDFEATTTSSFFGLKPSVSYQNRNLFRGAELFGISLSGGYEYYWSERENQHSYEIGASTYISSPRFITPFPVDRANRLLRPQSRVELTYNYQHRPIYHRTISGAAISYGWGNGRYNSFSFRPIDINVVNVSYIDSDFKESIENPYLLNSYESQFIAAISGSYTYNNPKKTANGNSVTFRVNAEAAGNITYLVSSLFENNKVSRPLDDGKTEVYYNIFGIRFSQYFRTDASFSNKIMLGDNTAFVYRVMGGIGIPYGNSNSVPMDRMFYSGGANSMRGWAVRTLGPGNSTPNNSHGFNSQMGNVKLEANIEFRFPLWNVIHGAVFFDAGNVWLLNMGNTNPEAVFRFDSFYKQLGLNTGLGIRADLGIAVIRLDWGIRLHNPNKAAGQRWFNGFKFNETALNIGIGYPF